MATRKQVPQPRPCAQCGTTFHTARQGHVHCSGACNTRAWRRRKPAPAPSLPLGATATPTPATPPVEASPVTLAFNGPNVGTLAMGTALGNLLSAGVQQLFAPTARAASASLPAVQFPTWPPAELLAAAQPAQWMSDPTWEGQLWLTPTLYQGHTLHLYVEAELPYVLWQAGTGEWYVLTTPAELRQLAAIRPVSPHLRAIHQQYGLATNSPTVGTLLPRVATAPQQLG